MEIRALREGDDRSQFRREQYGFVSVDVVEGQSDARPAPIPMFLGIRSIREALGAKGG